MQDRKKGLTMLEVMIASIILVVVVAMVFVIMNNATSQVNSEGANMVMQEKARKLLDDLSAELRMAQANSIEFIGTAMTTPGPTFLDTKNNNAPTPIDPLSGPPFAATVTAASKTPLTSSSTAYTLPSTRSRYTGIKFKTMQTTSSTSGAPVNDFDFTTNPSAPTPKYSRTVEYQLVDAPLDYQGQAAEILAAGAHNGIDDNKNTLIDERVLTRREYANNPVPGTLPTAIKIGHNLRGIAFEMLPGAVGTVRNQIIIHVMFQDLDAKGKLIWFYTNTTVNVRN